MKLLMTLLVRDEEDILRENLDFHLAQGVDEMIVTDNGSVDSTVEILREYEARGVVHVLLEPTDDYSQWRWVTRMARSAAIDGYRSSGFFDRQRSITAGHVARLRARARA